MVQTLPTRGDEQEEAEGAANGEVSLAGGYSLPRISRAGIELVSKDR